MGRIELAQFHRTFTKDDHQLVTNDSSKIVVARFHRPKGGFTLKPVALPSCLEIYPEGEHILNDILITFVYLRDSEES